MKYSEKVKASNKVLKAIKTLRNDEELKVAYQGKPTLFKIRAYESCGKIEYSIWQDFRGMNIGSVSSKDYYQCRSGAGHSSTMTIPDTASSSRVHRRSFSSPRPSRSSAHDTSPSLTPSRHVQASHPGRCTHSSQQSPGLPWVTFNSVNKERRTPP